MKKTLKISGKLLYFLSAFFLISCLSPKEIVYFQGNNSAAAITQNIDPLIQPGDLLSIRVASLNIEANSFFSYNSEKASSQPISYLVDSDGNIEFPLLGLVKLSGHSTKEAREIIRSLLQKYLESPSVMLRLDNFRITVLGEVTKPGVYNVLNERITLLEALGLAGDLTIYAKRSSVLLIREQDGKREFNRIDLTASDLFNSPFFYLRSNDVIYIEPGKDKIGSIDSFYRIMPIVMSGLTVLSIILSRVI